MAKATHLAGRRKARTRFRIRKLAGGRPRLSVFRSNRHIYAQVIDDSKGVTVAAASTLEKELRSKGDKSCDTEAAGQVGRLVAERAVAAGVKVVVFDRGAYRFHGQVRALAEAAREGGLSF